MTDEQAPDRKIKKANRKVFTEKNVLTLRARRKQYMVWDGGNGRGSGEVVRGLGILVSPIGAKSYRSVYYFPGSSKSHSRHLGRVGEMTLEEARKLCREDRGTARSGNDPRADDPSKSASYQAAVDDYIKRVQIGQDKNSSAEQARRVLLADCEDWHQRPLATIRNTEIQRLLELVRDGDEGLGLKPRPYLANLLYARMRPFFNWCAKPTINKIKHNPMFGIDKPFNAEQRREREWFKGTAADQAIKSLWQAADKLDKVEGDYLKVLLLTGKRKTALANMQWQQIDDKWFWDPPQTGKKNKRLHGVPLPGLAQRILHPRRERGFVFSGGKRGHIDVGSALQKKIIREGKIADFFLHGIRHLAETKMAELKIPPHIRDVLFDHAPSRGSGKDYDHHAYRDEMLTALETWADYIEGLVAAEGVRRLR